LPLFVRDTKVGKFLVSADLKFRYFKNDNVMFIRKLAMTHLQFFIIWKANPTLLVILSPVFHAYQMGNLSFFKFFYQDQLDLLKALFTNGKV